MTVEDQRLYIKIEILRDKNLTVIHRALREVYGEFTMDLSIVYRWANSFPDGRLSIDDDVRPGRPKTSTDERNMELVAYTPKDLCATGVEFFEAAGISPVLGKMIQTRFAV